MIFNNNKLSDILVSLDIGTSKIVCVVMQKVNDKKTVLGFGYNKNSGMQKNNITDIRKLRASIYDAIKAAEKSSGIKIRSLYLTTSIGGASSNIVKNLVEIKYGQRVSEKELMKSFDAINVNQFTSAGRKILHILPIEYKIDGKQISSSPIGLVGGDLGVKYNVITCNEAIIENLIQVVKSCGVEIEGITTSAYSSGLSCVDTNDKNLSEVIVIDIGATNTSIGVFKEGNVLKTFHIPLGGEFITMDIAHCFNTSRDEAERIKNLYGTTSFELSDSIENIGISVQNDNGEVEKKVLSQIEITKVVRPRTEEILGYIKMFLDQNKLLQNSNKVILTGGCSKLSGINDLAFSIFERQIVLGIPKGFYDIPEEINNQIFSSVLGVVFYKLKNIYHKKPANERGIKGLINKVKSTIYKYI